MGLRESFVGLSYFFSNRFDCELFSRDGECRPSRRTIEENKVKHHSRDILTPAFFHNPLVKFDGPLWSLIHSLTVPTTRTKVKDLWY